MYLDKSEKMKTIVHKSLDRKWYKDFMVKNKKPIDLAMAIPTNATNKILKKRYPNSIISHTYKVFNLEGLYHSLTWLNKNIKFIYPSDLTLNLDAEINMFDKMSNNFDLKWSEDKLNILLDDEVTTLKKFNEQINELPDIFKDYISSITSEEIKNFMIKQLKNNSIVDFENESDLIPKINYNNVFYDRVTFIIKFDCFKNFSSLVDDFYNDGINRLAPIINEKIGIMDVVLTNTGWDVVLKDKRVTHDYFMEKIYYKLPLNIKRMLNELINQKQIDYTEKNINKNLY